MRPRPAAAVGLLVGAAFGAGTQYVADDPLLAAGVAAVFAVAAGVAARWEPVAREMGLWDGIDLRSGALAGGGIVALALGAALLGVHPWLGLDAGRRLGLRLLVLGSALAGLYVGIAVVLLGAEEITVEPVDREPLFPEPETDDADERRAE